jgi:membrane associated rhomboid family serine protease
VFLPFGDYPNPSKPQWITRILLAANVLIHVFVAMPLSQRGLDNEFIEQNREVLQEMAKTYGDIRGISQYDVFTFEYGYKPGRPSLLALFFCMFLHANFMHLAGNMVYLWIFGDNIEARLGKVGYVLAYLGTGVLATLAFSLLKSGSMTPLVGASGAISGVLGLYLVWFPHNQIRVLLFFLFIMVVHVRAVWVLLVFLLLDFIPVLIGQETNVAHGAHVGGFLAGMGLAWLLNMIRGPIPAPRPQPYVSRRGTPWHPPAVQRPVVIQDAGAVFQAALKKGQMEEAAHGFARLLREGGAPPLPEQVFKLARWLYDNRFIPDAAAVFRYYIKNFPRGEDLDLVHLGLGVLLARHLHQPTAAREHLLYAIDLAGDDEKTIATARDELDRL